MPAPPESVRFDALVRSGVMRGRAQAALIGVAAGAAMAAAFIMAAGASWPWPSAVAIVVALAAAGAAIGVVVARVTPAAAVDRLEQQTPASRNLLRTALELANGRIDATPLVRGRVMQQADVLAANVEPSRAFPMRRAAIAAGAAVLAASVTIAATARRPGDAVDGPSSATSASIGTIDVVVSPPAYAGLPAEQFSNPARLSVLAGSRIAVRVNADAATVQASTVDGVHAAVRTDTGHFSIELPAAADGFISLEARSADETASDTRLIGIEVRPDAAPGVRVTAPGKDMLVPDANRTLAVALEAGDDLALASLQLTYTKISGSGENFEFVNGEVPLTLDRSADRKWTATANWNLGALGLGPGDMVVYRGVARDRRPDSAAVESDAFFVEIAAPGALPSEGFAVDDRFDRYAISQQMVILKTERLLAARASISGDEFRERALDLSAEQRQVRAEFVFMMGGSLEDHSDDADSLNEEEEAAGESDLAAGRLVNRGRAEITRAIRAMSRASERLADLDASGALPIEKEALDYLQRAFSRNRIILRTLSERERLDLSRRLTGLLTSLARDGRPRLEVEPDPVLVALRRALADLAALQDASDSADGRADRTRFVQRLLAISPTPAAVRDAAAAVTDGDDARAAALLAQTIREASPTEPPPPPSSALRALDGAVTDALRRGGRR